MDRKELKKKLTMMQAAKILVELIEKNYPDNLYKAEDSRHIVEAIARLLGTRYVEKKSVENVETTEK